MARDPITKKELPSRSDYQPTRAQSDFETYGVPTKDNGQNPDVRFLTRRNPPNLRHRKQQVNDQQQ